MGPKDAPSLLEHRYQMFVDIGNYSHRLLRAHLRWYALWAQRMRRERRFRAWGWEAADGELVASGALWLQEGRPHPFLGPGFQPYILSMYTAPAHRGKGLAAEIVREMLRWSAGRNYGRVILHASPMGRPVYEALGFIDGPEMRFNLFAHGAPSRRRSRRVRGR
ncbi:MAG: GNAT family N-acetyltransferase [Thermoplasmata archaeon]|nr:GNAT family N-acetyltransferase [Thermoplasmata archaeon]